MARGASNYKFLMSINKKQKGFTLIELMISIFILLVAIVGIFSAFSAMVVLTSDSTDRLTAAYLAQEGIEIVRNIRDNNWINMDQNPGSSPGLSWMDGLSGDSDGAFRNSDKSVDCSGGCDGDYLTGTGSNNAYLKIWSNGFTDYLNIDSSGFYGYGHGTPTKFKRKIVITPLKDSNNNTLNYTVEVMVLVSWDRQATIFNGSAKLAGSDTGTTCDPTNCVSFEAVLYDWHNYMVQYNTPFTGSPYI